MYTPTTTDRAARHACRYQFPYDPLYRVFTCFAEAHCAARERADKSGRAVVLHRALSRQHDYEPILTVERTNTVLGRLRQ